MKKNKTKKTMYKYIAPGVYQSGEGKYRVRKTIGGGKISVTFTNKAKAIKYSNSFN